MLTVRYWVLPRINEWRPLIEQHLSETVGAKVSIEEISADWSGLNPTLSVRQLAVHDSDGDPLIQVPDAYAVVSWRSLLEFDLRLTRLEVNGIDLAATRHPDGAISVAGHRLVAHSNEQLKLDRDTLAVRWLLDQGEIFIRQAQLRWTDQLRQAPVLNLSQIDLSLTNSLFRHELRLIASLPESVGRRIELVAKTENSLTQLAPNPKREAEIYLEVQEIQLGELAPWVDLPEVSGTFAARAWIDVQQGLLGQTVLEISGKRIALPLAVNEKAALFAQTGQMRLTGWLADLLPDARWPLLARSANQQGLAFSATSSELKIDSDLFDPSELNLGDVTARAKIFKTSTGELSIDSAQLDLKSSELAAQLQGSWVSDRATKLGRIDLTGLVSKAPVNKLHQYLTTMAPSDVRTFLRRGLTQGELIQTSVTLKGDLEHFPFDQAGDTGVLRFDGQYRGMSVIYDPSGPGEPNWPQLTQAQGKVVVDQFSLNLQAERAALIDISGARLEVGNLKLTIADLMSQPMMKLDAVLDGQAKDYLTVLRQAPLPSAIKPALEGLEAVGAATVPLAIQLKLDTDEAPRFQGRVNLSGAAVRLGREAPSLENIRGVIEFSDQAVRTDNLNIQFLGGESRVQGGWTSEAFNLQAEGLLTIAALTEFAGAKALLPLSGQSRYKLQLAPTRDKGFEAVLNATLEGLAVNLPAPLGKTAQERLPLTVRWAATPVKNDFRHTLSFSAGQLINGRFERAAAARPAPFFSRAGIAMGAPAQLPANGVALDLTLDKIDFEDWSALFEQVTNEPKRTSAESMRVFPRLNNARLRSPHFVWSDLSFTELDVSLTQNALDEWSSQITSKETDGVATWRAPAGALDGRVTARFSKLTLGAPDTGETEALKIDVIEKQQWSDIPAIDLTIDEFTIFGSQLGKLRLVGANQQRHELWTIEKLDIQNPFATTVASGQWRLKGPTRGVRLNAEVTVSDLGRFSAQMGHPGRVKGGRGQLEAQIDWVNFPWTYSYQGLSGSAKVDLKQGVFEHVNSRSARLLELLSLQSLQRILSFNFRPDNEFKDGFPWNSLTGSFEITKGVVQTSDLTVNSPIASILLTGRSDLDKKRWDMEADVRPLFDMSGAALATAFAVNPIAGLSALATQFLLRNPIEKAMTVKYAVTGPWDDPKIEARGAPEPVSTPNRRPSGPGN